ncbi:MAG: hypothetical protein WA191_14430 [Telluria sp.]
MSAMMPEALSQAAMAQARFALHEKLIRCRASLQTAMEVFPVTSHNVAFWSAECTRVETALIETGGTP